LNPSSFHELVFKFLEIPNENSDVTYSISETFNNTPYIDLRTLKKNYKPTAEYIEIWKEFIDNNEKKKIALEYLQILGEEIFEKLGYSYEETLNKLLAHTVKRTTFFPMSINIIQKINAHNKCSINESFYLRAKSLLKFTDKWCNI
jgi:hypothetical protein